jgi:uncharacterized tellurite resistance protein B-like protein
MADEENPDIYICALLTQMVTAREGDVRREFQAVVEVLNRLRGYGEEQVLILLQMALALDLSPEQLIGVCKEKLNDDQLRESIGLMAYLARLDGEISDAEEEMFANICVGLGVSINDGQVEISR